MSVVSTMEILSDAFARRYGVAAFNIVSSLIMMVKDKGRDIAILRTMGATRGAVMRIFLLCGASVGVIGTLTGAAVMAVIDDGCTLLGLTNPIQDIILGTIIVAAVTVDQLRQRRLAA